MIGFKILKVFSVVAKFGSCCFEERMSKQLHDTNGYPLLVMDDHFDSAPIDLCFKLPESHYVGSIDKAFFYDKSLKGDVELLRRKPLKCKEV